MITWLQFVENMAYTNWLPICSLVSPSVACGLLKFEFLAVLGTLGLYQTKMN
uniref:Uncharacterized protein n=1 Tax=Arundo donax TaxID=35708 RepID=A0A0A9H291_ARUDO